MKRGIVLKKLVIRFNAPATLTFALLALGALILGQTFGSAVTTKYFCVYRASLADPLTYLRFFTHVLGHADYSHYMGNMLLLLLVGPPLEEKYGWKKMVWFMAVTALVTGSGTMPQLSMLVTACAAGILGGVIGRRFAARMSNTAVRRLYNAALVFILAICAVNILSIL